MNRCLIHIVDRALCPELDEAAVQKLVDLALAEDELQLQQLNILLVDSAGSDALHREHFNVDGDTDVMSFPDGSRDPETERTHLGDLAVCVDVAQRIAAQRDVPCQDELLLYIIHGLLHLLGYDDQTSDERQEMWDLQRRYLQQLGITMPVDPDDY